MTCDQKIIIASVREQIAKLFASGMKTHAALHRYMRCTTASKCGRLCENFIKGWGVSQVSCCPMDAESIDLYPALENPEFKCPKGLF